MTVKHFPNDSALSCKIAKFYIHELNRGFKSGLLLRVEEHRTRHQNGMGKRETLSLIYDKCMQPGSLNRDKLMH